MGKRTLVVLLMVVGLLASASGWAGSARAADADGFVAIGRYSHWWDTVPSGYRIRFYWFDASGVDAEGPRSTPTNITVDIECPPGVACDPTPVGDHYGTGTATTDPATRQTVVTGDLPGCHVDVRFTAHQLQTAGAGPYYAPPPLPGASGTYGAAGGAYEWGQYTGALCGVPFETPWPPPDGTSPAFIEYTASAGATDVTDLGLGRDAINGIGDVTREQTVAHSLTVDYR